MPNATQTAQQKAALSKETSKEQSLEKDLKLPVLPFSDHKYTLSGGFYGVSHFLMEMDSFVWPSSLEDLSIELITGEQGVPLLNTGEAQIQLTFRERLYYYDYQD